MHKKSKVYLYINENKLLYLLAFIIFAILIVHKKEVYGMIVYNDEVGYWRTAAFLSGLDFDIFTKNTVSYYGYGYSFILTPLFIFFNDFISIYQFAILINAILLVITYFLLYNIMIHISDIDKNILTIISFAAIMNMGNVFQVYIAWTETLISFLFILVCWCLINVSQTTYILNGIIGFIAIYLYMVHQRNIGIIFAIIIYMTFLWYKKILDKKNIIVFTFMILLFSFVSIYMKQFIKNELYIGGIDANDYSSIFNNSSDILSLNGIINVFLHAISQLYYALIATFLLAFWAWVGIVKDFHTYFKTRRLEKNIKLSVFVGISYILMLGISAFFMRNGTGPEHVIYGRYIECFNSIFISLGICRLMQMGKKHNIITSIYSILFLIISSITSMNLIQKTTGEFNIVCVPALSAYGGILKNYNLVYITCIVIFIILIIEFIFFITKTKSIVFAQYVTSIFLMILFIVMGQISYYNFIPKRQGHIKSVYSFLDVVKQNVDEFNFLESSVISSSTKYITQFYFYQNEISTIENTKLSKYKDESFFIIERSELYRMYDKFKEQGVGLKVCTYEGNYILIQSLPNIDIDFSIPLFLFEMKTSDNKNDSLIINNEEGVVIWGPYLYLPEGDYLVSAEIELITTPEYGIIGLESYISKLILQLDYSEKELYESGEIVLENFISINSDMVDNKVEFRFFSKSQSNFMVKKIYIKKLN